MRQSYQFSLGSSLEPIQLQQLRNSVDFVLRKLDAWLYVGILKGGL